MLSEFKEWTGSDAPILWNATIGTGIGGSGKTSVGAKGVIKPGAWVSGPTETQVKQLSKLGSDIKALNKEELMRIILGD